MNNANIRDERDLRLLEQGVEIALTEGTVSVSLLQHRLDVGYVRAGRIIDEMERRGIVSACDGATPRRCLMTREEVEQMKAAGELGMM